MVAVEKEIQVRDNDLPWRLALLMGALLGGIGWGLFAAVTIGARGDQAHLEAIIGPRLLVAAAVSLGCVIAAATLTALCRSQTESRARALRGASLTLVIAPASGWVIIALQILQAWASGAW